MNDYQRFLESKKHSIGNFGFKATVKQESLF